MKKIILLFLMTLSASIDMKATSDFFVTNPDGVSLGYTVVSETDKTVSLTTFDNLGGSIKTLNIPGTIVHSGKTYTVVSVGQALAQWYIFDSLTFPETITSIEYNAFNSATIKQLVLPANLEVLKDQAFWAANIEEVWLPSKLKIIEGGALGHFTLPSSRKIHGFTDSQIEEIDFMGLQGRTADLAVLPSTIRILERSCFGISPNQLSLPQITIPSSMEKIGDEVYDISGEVYISHTTPFTLGTNSFGSQSTLKIYIPTDCSAAYKTATNWSTYSDKFREQLTIGSNGYSTYYLENENFKVPAGCTAYIITDVQPGATAAAPYKAMTQSIAAGSIIPKQTGFILQGTAGSTVEYEANVTGTEVSVSNNLLVGTATEAKVGNDGTNKYYLFGHKGTNQGFYWQTGTGGEYVNLKAHKAALKVAKSQVGYAKSFVIDFEDTTTGIRNIDDTTPQKNDIIYDLQGRRVINPTRGIYIVNGKKRVFN